MTATTTRNPAVDYLIYITKWTAALLIGWWADIPSAFHALLALMLLDIVTGLAVAWIGGSISSNEMRKGLIRKILTIIVLLTCHVAERAAGVELHLESIGAAGYCLNEVISIVENAARAGVPIPQQIVSALQAAKNLKGIKRAPASEISKLEE